MLEVATEGCCKGHPCDNCKTCQRGRCCRRDLPDYCLPKLGEWDSPMFGELGTLAYNQTLVECHCCGSWFRSLIPHIYSMHGLRADEYRAIFGLMPSTALVCPATSSKHSTHAKQMIDAGTLIPNVLTPEQIRKGTEVRMQGRALQYKREIIPIQRKALHTAHQNYQHKTHCKHGHEYTTANTGWQKTGRYCKVCRMVRRMKPTP